MRKMTFIPAGSRRSQGITAIRGKQQFIPRDSEPETAKVVQETTVRQRKTARRKKTAKKRTKKA